MAIMMMNQWLSRSDRQHQSMNEILSKVISVIDYRFIIQMIQTEGGHSHRDDGYDNDDNNNDGSSSCSGIFYPVASSILLEFPTKTSTIAAVQLLSL